MPLGFSVRWIQRITHVTVIILEHVFGGLVGTSLMNWIIGRNLQDLWYWISDIGLWPWSLGIASIITGILLLIRYTVRQPKLQWVSMLLITMGLVSLVFVAVAWAPRCGALMRFQVRAIAPDLAGGCIASYASNGSSNFEFKTIPTGERVAYHALSVQLKTFGEPEEQFGPGATPLLDFNSGIVISVSDRNGRDFGQAKTLRFDIKGSLGTGGLGIGVKDITGTEIKIVRFADSTESGQRVIREWTQVIINLQEFSYGNFRVDMSHLNAIVFFTTNALSGIEPLTFSIANIRIY